MNLVQKSLYFSLRREFSESLKVSLTNVAISYWYSYLWPRSGRGDNYRQGMKWNYVGCNLETFLVWTWPIYSRWWYWLFLIFIITSTNSYFAYSSPLLSLLIYIQFPFLPHMSDGEIQELLFPEKKKVGNIQRIPNCEYIHKELAKSGVTLSLLWNEYSLNCRENNEIPYSYRQFCRFITPML